MEEQFIQWFKDTSIGANFNLSRPKDVLLETYISRLSNAKNVRPVLSFIMKHFRSANERNHIRLNLKHASFRKQMIDNPGEKVIHCKTAALASHVHDIKISVDSDMEELLEIRTKKEKLIQKERELLNYITILNLATKKAVKDSSQYDSWRYQIMLILPSQNDSTSSPQDDSIKQESLKECLLLASVQLQEIRSNFTKNADMNVDEDKLKVWQIVEQLMEKNSPCKILKALEFITETDKANVYQCTKQIDLSRDAKVLRFKYESSGQFVDELGYGGILETVEMLLVHMNGLHIKSHFHNYELKRDAKSTAESIATVKKNINNAIEEIYSDNPFKIDEVKNFIEKSIIIVGLKNSLSRASKLSKELEERELSANKAMKVIMEKYSKILSFNKEVKCGMLELQNLNTKIKKGWDMMQQDLSSIQSHLKDHFNQVELPIISTELSLAKEAQVFLRIPLQADKFIWTPVESFNQSKQMETLLCDSLMKLTPTITSWKNLVELVRQRKAFLRLTQDDVLRETNCLDKIKVMANTKDFSSANIKGLCKKTVEFDKSLQGKVLPILEAADDVEGQIRSKLADVQCALHNWWTQPSQHFIKHL